VQLAFFNQIAKTIEPARVRKEKGPSERANYPSTGLRAAKEIIIPCSNPQMRLEKSPGIEPAALDGLNYSLYGYAALDFDR
jgi:hypothetical protein